jgi:hypothetical protein
MDMVSKPCQDIIPANNPGSFKLKRNKKLVAKQGKKKHLKNNHKLI